MKWFRPRIVLPGFFLLVSGAASCFGGIAPESVTIGAGSMEIFDSRQTTVFTAEARFAPVFFDLKPWIGGFLTTDDAWYLGAGLVWTLEKNDRPWFAGVGIGAGYYEQGDGKDLGSHFEVLSFVECGYRFSGNVRLTLRLSHISNASTASTNPGTEMLTLGCTVPLGGR
ncbi:Lipid A 3-O-deacylase (PagL) [Opitutaceae bacterium TAV1]|nr:Lipid A 3-O-deacylase (PagL) [Opitutaceae bacterium TAV1]